MDDRASNSPRLDPNRRDEWVGVNFLLGEVDGLRQRGLILDDACQTIVGEYSKRRDEIERVARFEAAIKAARDMAVISPRESLAWATRARELGPDRPEAWVVSIDILRRMRRFDEADTLSREAAEKFPDLVKQPGPARETARVPVPAVSKDGPQPVESLPEMRRPVAPPPTPRISWSSVAGEFLEEHWQKLISCLAVLLIVISSTVGASLVLGPLLWSPAGKGILALVFTAMCAGFGVGLVKWGAERAGQMMLATTLILIPINLMLAGELRLLADPSAFDVGLVSLDAVLLFFLARAVVSALGIPSGGTFTAAFFSLAVFNVGASRGMPFEVGFPIFLIPAVLFLVAVSWLNRRVKVKPEPTEEPPRLSFAYLEFGLLAFAFLSGVLRTGGLVLQLVPALYAIPTMLLAIAGVSTARAIEPIEKDRQRTLLFQQGGLVLSALAFALALARPPGVSALYSGNTLAVAVLGLALYATSLRATRLPAYLYAGFGALFLAYFGAFYFAKDLVRSVEEVARQAMGYDRKLPAPFRAINGLVFSVALALLSRFFDKKWLDHRLARHCHYIGLPFSIAACVYSGFEPKAALICLGGYAILYSLATRMFAEPRLIYLACASAAGSAYFGASLAGASALGLRSMISSALGLAFWAIQGLPGMKRAGEPYQRPLIRAARVMAAFAMVAATLASLQDGKISTLATCAFLLTATLTLLNGHESPRVSIYLLAIAALLGSWLGGYHLLNGGQPTTLMIYGLAIACFSTALLAAGEGARAWIGESKPTQAYLNAMGWAVPVIVVLAWALAGWALAGWGLEDGVPVARTFLVGSAALLWLTRFRRESVLVYLGLGGLAVWAACLCGLVVPWDRPGVALGWLSITWAGCSLMLWAVGEWVRRRGNEFYFHPCFIVAGCLAAGASGLSFDARWISVESYRLGVVAMLLGSASFGLTAASRRWPTAVALAIASAVGSSSLALISQGLSDADAIRWLGVMAASEAIACRGVGWLIRRFSGENGSKLARPLDFGALLLILAAIPVGYNSPTIVVLLAISSLLMIGCFPAAEWLYATFLAVGSAIYHAWLTGFSWNGLIPFVVLGAYLAWGLGVVLQRFGPKVGDRLGLTGLAFEWPPVRLSVILGMLAVVIRVLTILDQPVTWARLPWLPWTLAGLCLLMLRFEPRRGWIHAAVGLTGLGFVATLAPALEIRAWWLSASMALAIFWALAGRGAARVEASFRRRLGIADGTDATVIDEWARVLFGLSGLAILAIVVGTSFLPTLGGVSILGAVETGGWSDVILALGLTSLYVLLEGRRFNLDGRGIGLEVVAMLSVWWLGAPGSPLLGRFLIERTVYLPISTSAFALGMVILGYLAEKRTTRGVIAPADEIKGPRRVGLHEFTSWFGFGLGLTSVYFSVLTTERVALLSLLLATAALGVLALGWRRVESAYAGGVTWCLALPVGFVWIDRTLGLTTLTGKPEIVSLGLTTALFTLWWLAGWVRDRGVLKLGEPLKDGRIAIALEWVAVGTMALALLFAWVDAPEVALIGSFVLFALSVFFAMVAWRKGVEWPVYLAQGLLLASYFRVRAVLAPSGVVDAVVLSMLAYLDLGLSELMGRLRLAHYAKPTLRFAMVLPLVPIIQAWWGGRGDGVDLFILFATAAFYALASVRLQSKLPAYASAVLVNAFLWLAWHLLGWQLADRPQFYLIPVGFTSILFAEVNRQELSRSVVNGARNLGLVVIYASLAAPIWQTQSFGAWLALLLLSLLGIFVGIGLRVQSFLWLGLACFIADLTYQLGRLGMEHALARWGVMLSLGVLLILFVALNEKKRIVATMREYYNQARTWE